jgi:ribosomal protein S11
LCHCWCRKSTPAAAERAADELAKRALNLGYGSVTVKLRVQAATSKWQCSHCMQQGCALKR